MISCVIMILVQSSVGFAAISTPPTSEVTFERHSADNSNNDKFQLSSEFHVANTFDQQRQQQENDYATWIGSSGYHRNDEPSSKLTSTSISVDQVNNYTRRQTPATGDHHGDSREHTSAINFAATIAGRKNSKEKSTEALKTSTSDAFHASKALVNLPDSRSPHLSSTLQAFRVTNVSEVNLKSGKLLESKSSTGLIHASKKSLLSTIKSLTLLNAWISSPLSTSFLVSSKSLLSSSPSSSSSLSSSPAMRLSAVDKFQKEQQLLSPLSAHNGTLKGAAENQFSSHIRHFSIHLLPKRHQYFPQNSQIASDDSTTLEGRSKFSTLFRLETTDQGVGNTNDVELDVQRKRGHRGGVGIRESSSYVGEVRTTHIAKIRSRRYKESVPRQRTETLNSRQEPSRDVRKKDVDNTEDARALQNPVNQKLELENLKSSRNQSRKNIAKFFESSVHGYEYLEAVSLDNETVNENLTEDEDSLVTTFWSVPKNWRSLASKKKVQVFRNLTILPLGMLLIFFVLVVLQVSKWCLEDIRESDGPHLNYTYHLSILGGKDYSRHKSVASRSLCDANIYEVPTRPKQNTYGNFNNNKYITGKAGSRKQKHLSRYLLRGNSAPNGASDGLAYGCRGVVELMMKSSAGMLSNRSLTSFEHPFMNLEQFSSSAPRLTETPRDSQQTLELSYLQGRKMRSGVNSDKKSNKKQNKRVSPSRSTRSLNKFKSEPRLPTNPQLAHVRSSRILTLKKGSSTESASNCSLTSLTHQKKKQQKRWQLQKHNRLSKRQNSNLSESYSGQTIGSLLVMPSRLVVAPMAVASPSATVSTLLSSNSSSAAIQLHADLEAKNRTRHHSSPASSNSNRPMRAVPVINVGPGMVINQSGYASGAIMKRIYKQHCELELQRYESARRLIGSDSGSLELDPHQLLDVKEDLDSCEERELSKCKLGPDQDDDATKLDSQNCKSSLTRQPLSSVESKLDNCESFPITRRIPPTSVNNPAISGTTENGSDARDVPHAGNPRLERSLTLTTEIT